MIIIWVDKYHFRCNLAIGNGIKKFITISVVNYNFGCQFSTEIVINKIVIKSLFQFRLINLFQNNESCEFYLSIIIIWVDKYHFRCNLAIGNGIKKFITISVVYYNFGCQFSTEIVITEIVIKSLFQFRLINLFQNDESCEFFSCQ